MESQKQEIFKFIKSIHDEKVKNNIFPYFALDVDVYNQFNKKYNRKIVDTIIDMLKDDGSIEIGDTIRNKYIQIVDYDCESLV